MGVQSLSEALLLIGMIDSNRPSAAVRKGQNPPRSCRSRQLDFDPTPKLINHNSINVPFGNGCSGYLANKYV